MIADSYMTAIACENCECVEGIKASVFEHKGEAPLSGCRVEDSPNVELRNTVLEIISQAREYFKGLEKDSLRHCKVVWGEHIRGMEIGKRAYLGRNSDFYSDLPTLLSGTISQPAVSYSALEDFILTDRILTKPDDGCRSFILPYVVRSENVEMIRNVDLDNFDVLERDTLTSMWYAALHADMDYAFQLAFVEDLKTLEKRLGLGSQRSKTLLKNIEERRKLNGN